MNTNVLKRFATEGRQKLTEGVSTRLSVWFNEDGSPKETPREIEGGFMFAGQPITNKRFIPRWKSLSKRIEDKGFKEVVEEVAYTWFNRLVAIKILEHNNLCEKVLDYENPNILQPRILTNARAGRYPIMTDSDRETLNKIISNGSKTNEQFDILITSFCDNNPILTACFGGITDYVSLLLPTNLLGKDDFLDMLNGLDQSLSDEDWKKPELIGWLYQFYISDRKDEVMAKKGGYEASEIPAATQIFTPNWIVKYMVENTIGRIYLDNNPEATDVAKGWKYLVRSGSLPTSENNDPTDSQGNRNVSAPILHYNSLEDLKCGDLACGSGHILNEMFDILMQLYLEDFYSPRDAVESIFRNNLVGLDLDIRAVQLARFALLLKACQTDEVFKDGHCLPRILTFPGPYPLKDEGLRRDIRNFFGGMDKEMEDEFVSAIKLFENSNVLGSIMKFEIPSDTKEILVGSLRLPGFDRNSESARRLIPYFNIIFLLTDQYDALCMNPPYMSPSKENVMKQYVSRHYPKSKTDLFAVFMEVAFDRLKDKGKYGMINLPSWLFLSSFEDLRKDVIERTHIDSLIHMGRGIFGIDWGSVAFCCTKTTLNDYVGRYFRLHKRNFQHIYYFHIEQLFLNALQNPNFKYDFENYREEGDVDENLEIVHSDGGLQLFYVANQHQFKQIPGSPIAYWVSEKIRETFTTNPPLSAVASPCVGLQTADNGRFVRSWFEVNQHSIGFGCESIYASVASGRKFFPYNKGGAFRKWYGNQDYVVNWKNDGQEIRNFHGSVVRNPKTYFHPSISWSKISAGTISFRYFPQGFIYDVAGTSLFPNDFNKIPFYIAVVNSNVISDILKTISPTLNYEVGQIATLPITEKFDQSIVNLSKDCTATSKEDWNAHETSWDYQTNELVRIKNEDLRIKSLQQAYDAYTRKWTELFFKLHSNEEELNKKFIEIYGLQDELTPDVPFDEVTILQQGEVKIGADALEFQADVIIKQLISYAIGVMMGRYRLDLPGLAIAHPDATPEETAPYTVQDTGKEWWIDDDAIIPMLGAGSPFHDDAAHRLNDFLEIVFGADTKTQNINFVRDALGKDVADYLRNDFYTDHKKMYQNRPIYWMFSSNQKGKRAAFQVLVYMHRMDKFTPELVRTRYLLPYIEHLVAKEAELKSLPSLTSKQAKELKQITADIVECRDYQLRLHDFANQQISIDLDDGVVKNYATFSPILAKLK